MSAPVRGPCPCARGCESCGKRWATNAASFDAALLSADAALAVEEASAIEKMAATVKALAAARVAQTDLWRRGGDRSAAHELADGPDQRTTFARSHPVCDGVTRESPVRDGQGWLALEWLYPTCAAQGCSALGDCRWTTASTGPSHVTVFDLLDRLCAHHHGLKTHQGWTLVEGTGSGPSSPPTTPDTPPCQRATGGGLSFDGRRQTAQLG